MGVRRFSSLLLSLLVLFLVLASINYSVQASLTAKKQNPVSDGVCEAVEIKSRSSYNMAMANHHVSLAIHLHSLNKELISSATKVQLQLPDGVMYMPKKACPSTINTSNQCLKDQFLHGMLFPFRSKKSIICTLSLRSRTVHLIN